MFIWSTWQGTARVKPKNIMYHCPTTVQGRLSAMETLCDVYTKKEESLHVGVLYTSSTRAKGNLIGITEKLTCVPYLRLFNDHIVWLGIDVGRRRGLAFIREQNHLRVT